MRHLFKYVDQTHFFIAVFLMGFTNRANLTEVVQVSWALAWVFYYDIGKLLEVCRRAGSRYEEPPSLRAESWHSIILSSCYKLYEVLGTAKTVFRAHTVCLIIWLGRLVRQILSWWSKGCAEGQTTLLCPLVPRWSMPPIWPSKLRKTIAKGISQA